MNCPKCSQPLSTDAAFCSKCGASTRSSDTQSSGKAGQVLEGKWRLEKKIGEGGMGAVYLAHDLVLDRKVAIKLLAEALVHDQELVGRFEREARLTAGLEHPNIVAVYAVGRDGARPFMVMKYLEGAALSSFLRSRGRVSPDELLPLLRQIAAGLDFIHARGFIHRDIKTGNIFVGPEGHATLLDFGIVRPSRGAEAITRTGMVMGTPQYMSPEQALGIRDIDHRADLYALAVVIFECLTGKLPFDGDSDLRLVQMQAHGTPPDVRSLAPHLPPLISSVMARALAKRPEDRFPTAQELYLAVEAAFGVRFLTGPGGVPILDAAPVAYPIALQPPPAAFPIPLEPTPPAPGEPQRAFPITLDPTPPAPGEQPPAPSPTRASRPSLMPEPSAPAPRPARARRVIPIAAAVALVAGAVGYVTWPAPSAQVAERADAGETAAVAVAVEAPPDAGAPTGEEASPEGGVVLAAAEPAAEAEPEAEADLVELEPLASGEPEATKPAPPVRKKPGVGRVNVITTFKGGPYWASILINGERRGTTPALLELPPGSHRLRLERPGFRPIEKQIKVASGRSAVVRIELRP